MFSFSKTRPPKGSLRKANIGEHRGHLGRQNGNSTGDGLPEPEWRPKGYQTQPKHKGSERS